MYTHTMKIHMPPYAKQNLPSKCYFQQDNNPKQKSLYVSDFMKRRKVKILERPNQNYGFQHHRESVIGVRLQSKIPK